MVNVTRIRDETLPGRHDQIVVELSLPIESSDDLGSSAIGAPFDIPVSLIPGAAPRTLIPNRDIVRQTLLVAWDRESIDVYLFGWAVIHRWILVALRFGRK